ncbi:hypothetical protein D2E28_05470 [Mycobacteroides abscessus]|nr:hypothetical protein DDJ52_15640 [Mycobacteroides abscessus]RIR29705.1 hypothetical protein D2E28_05470 [Mycobacteroides abscessus]
MVMGGVYSYVPMRAAFHIASIAIPLAGEIRRAVVFDARSFMPPASRPILSLQHRRVMRNRRRHGSSYCAY